MGMLAPVIAVLTTIQSKTELNYEDLMNVINLLNDILSRLNRERSNSQNRHN